MRARRGRNQRWPAIAVSEPAEGRVDGDLLRQLPPTFFEGARGGPAEDGGPEPGGAHFFQLTFLHFCQMVFLVRSNGLRSRTSLDLRTPSTRSWAVIVGKCQCVRRCSRLPGRLTTIVVCSPIPRGQLMPLSCVRHLASEKSIS